MADMESQIKILADLVGSLQTEVYRMRNELTFVTDYILNWSEKTARAAAILNQSDPED
jgi:hypothetical protein